MAEQWRELRPGDSLRLRCVPKFDLEQRVREQQHGVELAGLTADTLERILELDPIVTIDRVDEDGAPWFEYELKSDDGEIEYHSIAITDDESWERVAPT
ncbi:hypothetical protein OAS39_06965 [Pirellulales bacterium]|nr:hypothetical protein [Pirellulales bacterium]